MKVIGLTQARIGSSRLPRKVLLEVNGKTLLQYHLERAASSSLVNKWIVATTNEADSDLICEVAAELSITSYKGDLSNVLDRFYQAVKNENADYVVRITSDCPLIDGSVIDEIVKGCIVNQYDYYSNTLDRTFPDGIDVEVFKFSALEKAWNEAQLHSEKEHVTPYIWKNSTFFNHSKFISGNYKFKEDFSTVRMTVDQSEDFLVIKKLIEELGSDRPWIDYANYLINNVSISNVNAFIKPNEGYMKSIEKETIQLRHITNFKKSDEYRNQIHDLIPGGAHTYSKGDDQFPLLSPAAIAYGKGAHVWDIDDNKYLDCSMGLTSVSLGHAYEPVIASIKEELNNGVNFQRPSILEKEMAEKFLSLIPQHDMVKFAKNGSIVTTAAVKLARAKTGRKLVAFPGDHPFYSYDDWFIGKTDCNKGVPDEVKELSVTFKSCDINSLTDLFNMYPNQIACVIMEPERSALGVSQFGPDSKSFLQNAIELTHKNGALFIIDEMITGFKSAFPGSMTKFNLEPDMATWGKGIANGFSFCALTGKKEVMELGGIRNKGSEKVFLTSTTHGGETHSIAAGISTINEFQSKNVIEHNQKIGDFFIEKCNEVITQNNLLEYVEVIANNWMPIFIFKDNSKSASSGFRTLALQEMIKRGVLFQGAFVPCYSHTMEDVNYFAAAFNESLIIYKKALAEGFEKFLVGEPTKPVFRKLL